MLMRPVRLTSRLVLFSGALLVCSVIASGVTLVEVIRREKLDRTPFARFCFDLAARCLGFRVSLKGQLPREPVLLISNHVSWSDIPILGGVVPLRFLSKSEVRAWPLIGWLAEQAGTLFIKRGGGQAHAARDQIAETLAGGQSVLVFPEGTTTIGITVLPFHGRLLPAAIEAGVAIQPISIGYRRDDHPDHLAPFVGDDRFESHIIRMLKEPAVNVEIILHEPVAVQTDTDIQALTQTLHRTVEAGLKSIHQSPGANDTQTGFPASRPHLDGA